MQFNLRKLFLDYFKVIGQNKTGDDYEEDDRYFKSGCLFF